MCFQIIWSLLCLEFKISGNKEILRCEKGLVTSQNIGYLFYFFLRMEGCRGKKKIYGFERDLVLYKIYTWLLMGEKKRHNARFFSPKDLYIFCSTEDTIQNRRLFFLWTIFPPKERNFVCRIAVGFFNGVDSLIDSFLANITSYACACIFTTYYTRGVW